MATFTPGPWAMEIAEDGDEETGGYGTSSWTGNIITEPCETNPEGDEICQVWPPDKATGHLISAAPDLLAACELFHDMMKTLALWNEPMPFVAALHVGTTYERVQVALKKARGEA